MFKIASSSLKIFFKKIESKNKKTLALAKKAYIGALKEQTGRFKKKIQKEILANFPQKARSDLKKELIFRKRIQSHIKSDTAKIWIGREPINGDALIWRKSYKSSYLKFPRKKGKLRLVFLGKEYKWRRATRKNPNGLKKTDRRWNLQIQTSRGWESPKVRFPEYKINQIAREAKKQLEIQVQKRFESKLNYLRGKK